MLRRLLSYLTFPGIIVHECAHAWACRRLGIRVLKVCYLRIGNPMGYVLHERPTYALQHIAVATAPFLVSSLAALACSLAGALAASASARHADSLGLAACWLSFSIALHAFPSNGDGDALWNEVAGSERSIMAKALLAPVVGLIRLGQRGTAFWCDVLYAMVVTALPPLLVAAAHTQPAP